MPAYLKKHKVSYTVSFLEINNNLLKRHRPPTHINSKMTQAAKNSHQAIDPNNKKVAIIKNSGLYSLW